jgi:hypothetical protein
MSYKCEKCNYSTDNKFRYNKHINRKIPCKNTNIASSSKTDEDIKNSSFQNPSTFSYSSSNSTSNEQPDVEQIMQEVNQSLQTMNGEDFTRTTTNTTTNIQNNNIYINCFGKDDLRFLLGDNHIINRLEHYSPDGVYALIRLDDAHTFNRTRSIQELQNTDKFLKYIRDPLDRYVDIFKHIIKGENIVLNNPKDQLIIKKLLSILLTVGGMLSDEISQKLHLHGNDEGILKFYDSDDEN